MLESSTWVALFSRDWEGRKPAHPTIWKDKGGSSQNWGVSRTPEGTEKKGQNK